MDARSRIALATLLAGGVATLLFRVPAAAAEEPAEEPKRADIVVEIDGAPLQIDAAKSRLAIGESIRAALGEAEKRSREIEVANARTRNGG